ncbi:hypothetical protein [Paenibacillus tyrfis]|uniref:hypothetical protein n=1 Tax=Paenibacillus tyrfis TaxID=1501230 RepID=UPI0020A1E769|nr:hypothetical protein [Paenibacillus tyrfis]MCP1309967.1 hypothetical protein [Paenibacillus tyrfis]
MKSSFKVFVASSFAIGLIASSLWLVNNSNASAPDVQEAKKSVQNYFAAIEKKDVNEITEWVKDTRFDSVAEQKYEYNQMLTTAPFEKHKIANIEKIDDKTFAVTIQMSRKKDGIITTQVLPVVKDEKGQWKLLVTGKEIRVDK